MPSLIDNAFEIVSPSAAELMPPPDGETVEDDEEDPSHAFGGGHVELSLLPLYPNHTARHIWDREVKLVGLIFF